MTTDQSNDDRGTGRTAHEVYHEPNRAAYGRIVYGATLLLNGILFNSIWWYAVWKRRLVRSDLDAPAMQRITRGYLFGLPFYALSIVLSLLNVELSLTFDILIDLMYGLPIRFLRFGSPDIFSVGAQEAPEGHLPHAHAKNKLLEVDREPE